MRLLMALSPLTCSKIRIDYAFELIRKANTITTLSLDEMQRLCERALEGDFDEDIVWTK